MAPTPRPPDLPKLAHAGDESTAARLPPSGPWLFDASPCPLLPPTLPNGQPWPKISIIIPVRNPGRSLEEAVLSVVNQAYPNVDIIVMDAGATDEVREIVQRYRPYFAEVVRTEMGGPGQAIHQGLARATGDILAWLSGDDLLAPGALAGAALAFHTSGADMVSGICQIVRDGMPMELHMASCPDGPLSLDALLDLDKGDGPLFYPPAVLFTRQLWDKAGGPGEDPGAGPMAYELWLRFAAAGARLHVIGRLLGRHRVPAGQKSCRAELQHVRDTFLARTGCIPRPAGRGPAIRQSLKIVFLNDMGFQFGAGIAHQRLAEMCAVGGHSVQALALVNGNTTNSGPSHALLRQLEAAAPDLVVVGNLHAASADPSLLGLLASRWPTVSVLHDFWAVTGRCAYPMDCTRYRKGCDHTCPTHDEYPRLEPAKIRDHFRTKQRVHCLPRPPVMLAYSRWAQETAEQLLLPGPTGQPGAVPCAPVGLITLGLPLDVFRPRDKAQCRALLGLPQDRFLLLTGACSVTDERKGIRHLIEALRALKLPDTLVLFIGKFRPQELPDLPDYQMLGFLDDPERLALAYAAADVFVAPSLAETLGQVFREAAACGTPAVGYATTGVTCAIADGITGRLASAVGPGPLAQVIEVLYRDPERRAHLGQWARLHVENEWSYASSYHSFLTALRASPLQERLALAPTIALAARPAQLPKATYLTDVIDGWSPLAGFSGWEGPFFDLGLPRSIWILGPSCRFQVNAAVPGPHRLAIRCLNSQPGQRVRVVVAGDSVGSSAVPLSGSYAEVLTLEFPCELREGRNTIELFPEKWSSGEDDPRPRALLLLQISARPDNGAGCAAA